MYQARTLEAFAKTAVKQFPVLLSREPDRLVKQLFSGISARMKGAMLPLMIRWCCESRQARSGTLKKTASPEKNDVRHFQALEKLELPIGPGGLICLAGQSLPLTPSVRSIPITAF